MPRLPFHISTQDLSPRQLLQQKQEGPSLESLLILFQASLDHPKPCWTSMIRGPSNCLLVATEKLGFNEIVFIRTRFWSPVIFELNMRTRPAGPDLNKSYHQNQHCFIYTYGWFVQARFIRYFVQRHGSLGVDGDQEMMGTQS